MGDIEIYNLEFPNNVHSFQVAEYTFTRVAEYKDRIKKLSHSYSYHSDVSVKICSGEHIITAYMSRPEKENEAVLPWSSDSEQEEYLDVLLILSITTGRNIFAKNWSEENVQIISDSRQQRGRFIRFVFPVSKGKNNNTGEVIDGEDMDGRDSFLWKRFDQGLEITANKILSTIRDTNWQKKYQNGSFLFIFNQSLQRQRTESAFILSWSIWEHVFSVCNNSNMTDEDIMRTSGNKKYKYIKEKFFNETVSKEEQKELAGIRNRLIHFGLLPVKTSSTSIDNFFRDTENLVANILSLTN